MEGLTRAYNVVQKGGLRMEPKGNTGGGQPMPRKPAKGNAGAKKLNRPKRAGKKGTASK